MQIFLIGLMGAGKTTVGKLLANRLRYEWLDSDKVLEMRCGMSINTLFEQQGESTFRNYESILLDELTQKNNVVLSTGGGVILREENRIILSNRGIVVYLKATPHELWLRTRYDKTRPLLQGNKAKQTLFNLYDLRHCLYQATAHITVSTGQSSVQEVVNQIQTAIYNLNLNT